MGRPTLNEVQSVGDFMPSERFELLLGNLPGGLDSAGLRIKCQQCPIPGFTIEQYEAALHGQVLRFPGRKTYSGTLSITFLETADMSTSSVLRRWGEFIKSKQSGRSSGTKSQYSVTARLNVYDGEEILRDEIDVFGCWLSDFPEVSLDGQSSQAMLIPVTLSYDHWDSILSPSLA